jgi:hypothetical protein
VRASVARPFEYLFVQEDVADGMIEMIGVLWRTLDVGDPSDHHRQMSAQ